MQKLKDKGIVIAPIAQNNNYLFANFVTATNISDKDLSLLLPIKKQLIWLNLNDIKITDSGLAILGQCTDLIKLELAHTNITDKGLAYLKDLKQLRLLNVVGTKITAAGIMRLKDLKNLQSLYLFQTSINKDNWIELKKTFPKTAIDSGGYTMPFLPDDTVILKAPPTKK